MHDLIDVVGRDARLDFSRGDVEDFPSEATDLSHALLLFFVEHLQPVPLHDVLQND